MTGVGWSGVSPLSWMGATASCGSTAELGPVVVRPSTVRWTSGPRSQSEANRVAFGVLEVTSRLIRPLPTRDSELSSGSVVNSAA